MFCDCCLNREAPEDPILALLRARKQAREAAQLKVIQLQQLRAKKNEDIARDDAAFEMEAQMGVDFIKHGREGRPHSRTVKVQGVLIR